jgi:Na+/proline symporter
MEETENTEGTGEVTEMLLTFEAEGYLRETGKWANFLGMAGFMFSILTIISAFSVGPLVSQMQQTYHTAVEKQALSNGFTFMFILFGILIFLPSCLLFHVVAGFKNGFNYADQPSLNLAFQKLKSYFKFFGILVISFIAFYAISIIAALAGGGAVR